MTDISESELQELQETLKAAMDEFKVATDDYEKAKKAKSTNLRGYELELYRAGNDLRLAQEPFQNTVNVLVVDVLDAIVKNDKNASEKFALLRKYGPKAGFGEKQSNAMAGAGGDKYGGGKSKERYEMNRIRR